MAFEEVHFPVVLQVLTEGFSSLPRKIVLIADDETALEQAWQNIPDAVHDLIDARMLPYPLMIHSRFNKQVKVWNLLKGQFAYTQQWLAMIQPWKWVLACFLAALILNMGMLLVEYRQLTAKNTQLNAEVQNWVRKVIPRGQIVNPRKQLQHELDVAQQGGSGGFMQKLQKMGSVLSKHQVQTMNSLNYEKDKNEIRMDIVLPNYDQLQAIINELQQLGLNADIQNSNAQGDQLRARIRISG
jgi:type II secretion system protein L